MESKIVEKIKEFYNIYTGEKCNNKFESLGFKEYEDKNKKIYLNYNKKKIKFNYRTNTEYSYNDLKFIICTVDNENMIIMLNKEVENNEERRLRSTFIDEWEYFKIAYEFRIEETIKFKYLKNYISISIK